MLFFFRFSTQYILMENILLFVSNKYIDSIESIKDLMKSGNNIPNYNHN